MKSVDIPHEVSLLLRSAAYLLLLALAMHAAEPAEPNWGGKYSPCDRHPDLLNHQHVDLAVRLSTTNTVLARQFERAMEFWAKVVDFDWHEVGPEDCSMQLVEGTEDLFKTAGIAARSQEPDRPGFQGWIAFNPNSKLSEHEMYVVSVHEIGHLLGLAHNPNSLSVMFFFNLDDSVWLDAADLTALAGRHQLRSGVFENGRISTTRLLIP